MRNTLRLKLPILALAGIMAVLVAGTAFAQTPPVPPPPPSNDWLNCPQISNAASNCAGTSNSQPWWQFCQQNQGSTNCQAGANVGASNNQFWGGASQGCSTTGTTATCTVTTPVQLSGTDTVFAIPFGPSTSTAACTGTSAGGYVTQGASAPLPASAGSQLTASTGCAFELTSGTASTGASVGSEGLTLTSTAYTSTPHLAVTVCSDPTCATVISSAVNGSGNGFGGQPWWQQCQSSPNTANCPGDPSGQWWQNCQNNSTASNCPNDSHGQWWQYCQNNSSAPNCPGDSHGHWQQFCQNNPSAPNCSNTAATTYQLCNGTFIPTTQTCSSTVSNFQACNGGPIPFGASCTGQFAGSFCNGNNQQGNNFCGSNFSANNQFCNGQNQQGFGFCGAPPPPPFTPSPPN